VESLREHYTLTLRHWGRRLEARHAEATRLVGEGTVRVRRLYMAAAARAFATGGVGVVQALLSKPDAAGVAGLPLTRADLYTSAPGRSAPQPPQAQSRPRPEPRPERRMSYTR
jgi:cyclopropane-fatty-acyl-phospholipid synthase